MTSGIEADQQFARADAMLPAAVASAVGYSSQGDLPGLHRGLPSPYVTFIVSLDGPVVGGYTPEQATGDSPLRADVLAAGLHTEPSYVVQPERQSGIQLAIAPTAVRRLFGLPLGQLHEQSWNAADLLGPSATRLWDQLGNTPDWTTRFAVLQEFLRQRADASEHRAEMRPEMVEAWRWLVRHRGAGTIGDLSGHVHLSRRQLQTLFVSEFGVGPKSFNRLIRFNQVVQLIGSRISAGGAVDLARIAGECGFSDQPHLNRDFATFTGTSPTAWIAEEFANLSAGGHRNGSLS